VNAATLLIGLTITNVRNSTEPCRKRFHRRHLAVAIGPMKRTTILAFALPMFALGACGDDNTPANGDANKGPKDAPNQTDAAIDAPTAPAMITITGTATERQVNGTVKVNMAKIEAFENSNETTPVATAMTNAQGNFTLTVNTGGFALNGFIKATKTNLKDTYLYPTGFIAADLSGVPIQMVSPQNYDNLSVLGQGNQTPGNAVIALQVLDGAAITSTPVAGATVATDPAGSVVRYTAAGLPSPTATVTATDGVAFVFNVPPNINVSVSAQKSGSTFASHNMKSWPDALNTTLITP
jgi:hypothetical protein